MRRHLTQTTLPMSRCAMDATDALSFVALVLFVARKAERCSLWRGSASKSALTLPLQLPLTPVLPPQGEQQHLHKQPAWHSVECWSPCTLLMRSTTCALTQRYPR